MAQAKKVICYDTQLQLEAYTFTGVSQNFPNHFHDYYVIGLIEAGERHLVVNQQEYIIGPGDLLTFNPYDKHSCEEISSGRLTYRCFNLQKEKMGHIMALRKNCRIFFNPFNFKAVKVMTLPEFTK